MTKLTTLFLAIFSFTACDVDNVDNEQQFSASFFDDYQEVAADQSVAALEKWEVAHHSLKLDYSLEEYVIHPEHRISILACGNGALDGTIEILENASEDPEDIRFFESVWDFCRGHVLFTNSLCAHRRWYTPRDRC